MDDVNIVKVSPLLPPACLIEELPVSAGLAQTIRATRKRVQASVGGQSDKLIVVVGQFWKRNPTPTPPFDRESALGNTALAREWQAFRDLSMRQPAAHFTFCCPG